MHVYIRRALYCLCIKWLSNVKLWQLEHFEDERNRVCDDFVGVFVGGKFRNDDVRS